jgi:hypothetical protein
MGLRGQMTDPGDADEHGPWEALGQGLLISGPDKPIPCSRQDPHGHVDPVEPDVICQRAQEGDATAQDGRRDAVLGPPLEKPLAVRVP